MKENKEIEETKEIPIENKTTYERIPETELEFSSIIARKDKDNQFVTQIRFMTPEEECFTWKPSITEVVSKKGSIPEEITKSPKNTGELPKIITEMYLSIMKNKTVCIKATYTKMTTLDKTGKDVSYCFFQNSDIENLEII